MQILFHNKSFQAAAVIFTITFLTLAGAWAFQFAGYAPCELCLLQRYAYYASVPLCLFIMALLALHYSQAVSSLFFLVALIFLANFGLGVYHSGVEFHWWAGPSACTGDAVAQAPKVEDFLKQLQSVKVVRCDIVSLYVLGLSLSVWNALISLCLAVLASIAGVLQALTMLSMPLPIETDSAVIPLDFDD